MPVSYPKASEAMALSRFARQQNVCFCILARAEVGWVSQRETHMPDWKLNLETSWSAPTAVLRLCTAAGEDVELQAAKDAMKRWNRRTASMSGNLVPKV